MDWLLIKTQKEKVEEEMLIGITPIIPLHHCGQASYLHSRGSASLSVVVVLTNDIHHSCSPQQFTSNIRPALSAGPPKITNRRRQIDQSLTGILKGIPFIPFS